MDKPEPNEPSALPVRSPYAQWKTRPEDPTTPWGWVVWGETLPSTAARRPLALAALGSLPVLALLLGFFGLLGLGIWLFIAYVGFGLYIRPGAREHGDLATLGIQDAYPVRMDIWHRGKLMGRDKGWVSFVDGWLIFEGLRTEFSIRSTDANRSRRDVGRIVIVLSEGGMITSSTLTNPVETSRPGDRKALSELSAAVHGWRKGPKVAGQPIFPPFKMSHRILAQRTAGFGTALVANLFLTALFLTVKFYIGALFALAISVGFIVAAYNSWYNLKKALKPTNGR